VVCVGETLAEREAGQTEAVVGRQLQAVLDALSIEQGSHRLAYEPVWAIGTGKTATSAQAQEVHAALRARSRRRMPGGARMAILYGGSVKPDNAANCFPCPISTGPDWRRLAEGG
jgi:triosephosphate isomerase